MRYTLSVHPLVGHQTIRNICIVDCQTDEDYQRIRFLCGDYREATCYQDMEVRDFGLESCYRDSLLLYDDLSHGTFMYFWKSEPTPTPDTHHFMTVQEFYDLFDPTSSTTTNTPYEYW